MRFALLLLAVLLSGCTKDAPVSSIISENAINAATALEKTLPAECKTEGVTTQITVIKTEIRAVAKACDAEKESITREKMRWFWAFWSLVVVIGVYIVRKVVK